MLEPLAVDPNRSVAPAANSIASARLVFPAPAGPTSAITRVPFAGCPAMRLSFVRCRARESRRKALGRRCEDLTVRLFSALGKRSRYGPVAIRRVRLSKQPKRLSGRQQPALTCQPQQRGLQLLERAHLDLPDALAADAIHLAQLLERLRLVRQP